LCLGKCIILANAFFIILGEFKGLAELVRLCTGTPLNKDEQWSNWEKRPLRDTQSKY